MFFSIIIPVYNVERYLMECVESLRNQTFQDFEAIFVDDGSKDKSGEMCDNLYKDFPELCVRVFHQQNAGQIAARQKGMEMARGEYCLFLDSDDTFVSDALQKVADAIGRYQPDMVIFNGVRRVGNSDIPFWPHYCDSETLLAGDKLESFRKDVIASSRFNNICFKAIKRSVLMRSEKYQDVSYIKNEEDYLMQLPIFDEVKSLVYTPHNIYVYRYNASSVTNVKFDINRYKAGRFIFNAKLKYARKWEVSGGAVHCNHYLMSIAANAVKQFKNSPTNMTLQEKKLYLETICKDELFRTEYQKFDGAIKTLVGRAVLWLLYHRCWSLALFIAEHDPKVHGEKVRYVG